MKKVIFYVYTQYCEISQYSTKNPTYKPIIHNKYIYFYILPLINFLIIAKIIKLTKLTMR